MTETVFGSVAKATKISHFVLKPGLIYVSILQECNS